jgi:hypothetical protein
MREPAGLRPMTKESRTPERTAGQDPLTHQLQRIWPRMVELWIALVLLMFFLIRIWGSQTAKHILNLLGLGRMG